MGSRFILAGVAGLLVGCGGSVHDSVTAGKAGSACSDAYEEAEKLLETTGAVVGPGIPLGSPGRLLLSFDSSQGRDAGLTLLRQLGAEGLVPLNAAGAYRNLPIVLADLADLSEALIGTLTLRLAPHGLLSVYPDRELDLLLMDSAEFVGAAYGRSTFGIDGSGVGIAVIDAGVNELQGDFANVAANYKVVGNPCYGLGGECEGAPSEQDLFEFVDVTGASSDTSSGHGTHVAGIAAGTGAMSGGKIQGMAPGATLVAYGIGEGVAVLISYAVAAFDHVIEHGAEHNVRVTNNSYGGGAEGAGFTPFDPISVATRAAHDAGIISVFAAGNTGDNGSGGATSTMISHAASPCVISVAAGIANAHVLTPYNTIIHDNVVAPATEPAWIVDSGDARGTLGWFSSRGMKDDPFDHPDITAPGDLIVSALAGPNAMAMFAGIGGPYVDAAAFADPTTLQLSPFYWRASGTSMASPHVAGIVALLLQAKPDLTLDQILGILTSTADPMTRPDGTPYEEWEAGAGFVNVDGALARVLGVSPFADQVFERVGEFAGEVPQAVTDPLLGTPVVPGESEFSFTLPPGSYHRLEVFVGWSNPLNDIDIDVVDPDGVAYSSGNPPGLFETAYVENPLPGAYTVKVRGYLNMAETFDAKASAYRFVGR